MHSVHNDEVKQEKQLKMKSEQSLHYAMPSELL